MKILAYIGLLLVAVVSFVGIAVLYSAVLMALWGWFITPVFGIAVPSLPLTMGLFVIVGYIRADMTKKDNDKEVADISTLVFYPLFVLALGWVIHLFV